MSAAVSHEFLNDLNETDFPYLDSKPVGKRAEKGRRCEAVKMYVEKGANLSFVAKTVHDPQQVLGKRRKARLLSNCSDNFAENVVYSVNRKNRWELNAENVLENADSSEVDVAFVEKTLTHNDHWYPKTENKIDAIHIMDKDGNIKTRKAKGSGATTSCLLSSDKKKKSASPASASDEEIQSEMEEDRPRIEYRVSKPHHNPRVLVGNVVGRHSNKTQTGRRRNKQVDLSHLDHSDLEVSVHLEDNDVYKPSRDFRFCLADYMTSEKPKRSSVRKNSGSSVKNIELVEKEELPVVSRCSDVIDISSIVRTPSVFECTSVITTDWHEFNFNKQVDEMSGFNVRWLDANHQRASVDLTSKFHDGAFSMPQAVIVLEKCRRNMFRLVLNCSFVPAVPLRITPESLDSILKQAGVNSIQKAVEAILKMLLEEKDRCVRSGESVVKSSFLHDAINYQSAVNCKTMTKQALVISGADMASMVRQTAPSEAEPFERIDDETLSSDEDSLGFETNLGAPVRVKCSSCMTSSSEELFELDDCWQCRECLRATVVQMIRTKNIPLEIPFVTDVDGSLYDILPALIPMPLIAYYTKMASTEILKSSDSEIGDILECPGCRNTVIVARPNELHSCCCSECGVSWCVDCHAEPHWPVNCEKFPEWNEKWTQQYPFHVMADDVSSFIRRITCKCGHLFEVGDLNLSSMLYCECGLEINPETMKGANIDRKTQKDGHFKDRKFARNFTATFIDIHVVHHIKKEYAQLCAEARQLRFNHSKSAEVAKKCRRVKGAANKLPEIRLKALYLVEFGLAHLYQEKGGPQGMKAALTKLMRHLIEAETILDIKYEQNENDDGNRNLTELIASLDSSIDKAVALFKASI